MTDTPTAPNRRHRTADHPPFRPRRDQRRTLSTTTRTCNKLRSVDWFTGEVR